MIPAVIEDEVLVRGANFRRVIIWETEDDEGVIRTVDLSDATVRMQVRRRINSPDVELDLALESYIWISNGPAGEITIDIPGERTAQLQFKSGVFDIEVEFDQGEIFRLAQGTMVQSPEVTRDE